MKRTKRLVVACILIWIGGAGFGGTDVPEGSVAKLSLETPGGGARDYFVYVPTGVQAEGVDVPLLVTLAGTRVHAGLMVEMWRGIADAAHVVIVSPEPSDARAWLYSEDGPPFFYRLIEGLKEQLPIDGQRVYLFGHSGGGTLALVLALLEPGYFTAVTAVGGGLPTGKGYLRVDPEERRIPILLLVAFDEAASVTARQTKEALDHLGYSVQVRSLYGVGHDYYSHSRFLNDAAWEFLRQYSLEYSPYFKEFGSP